MEGSDNMAVEQGHGAYDVAAGATAREDDVVVVHDSGEEEAVCSEHSVDVFGRDVDTGQSLEAAVAGCVDSGMKRSMAVRCHDDLSSIELEG